MSILETRVERWPDEAACAASAAALAGRPGIGAAIVALDGTLGAGKTTFVRHLLRALGVVGTVRSPTYTVVEPYALPTLNVWHFDYYRFTDPREWEDAGFRDIYASDGLKISEWPDKVSAVAPPSDLVIAIAIDAHDDGVRSVRFDAHTPLGIGLLP